MQRENINHWETGVWVPGMMEQLHICASFLLPSGGPEVLCAAAQPLSWPWVMGIWGNHHPHQSCEDRDTPRKTLPLPELWGKHNHSSSHHCCSRTTCTEQSHHQGLRAGLKPGQHTMPTPHVTEAALLSNLQVFTTTSSLWLSVCLFTRAAFLNMPTVKSCNSRGVPGLRLLMSNAVTCETKMHPQKQLLWREREI